MNMRAAIRVAALALALQIALADDDNNDYVLAPPSNAAGPEKLMVFIPGANVPSSHYVKTAAAIQSAAAPNMRLWVSIPSMGPTKLCIIAESLGFLEGTVHKIMLLTTKRGFTGKSPQDVFIGGHSLGGVCAGKLAAQQHKKDLANSFSALVVFGSYVDKQDVAAYPIPVLTLGGELDGGAGRPESLLLSLTSSDVGAVNHNFLWQLQNSPVAILPGIDHSSFCPGFEVPGDVYPADVSDAVALPRIGATTAAFLTLQVDANEEATNNAYNVLTDAMTFTRELVLPLQQAAALAAPVRDAAGTASRSPWCEAAQMQLVEALPKEMRQKLSIGASPYLDTSKNFEHSRVHYASTADGGLSLNISGHNDFYGTGLFDLANTCVTDAQSIDCKLVSGARIAQQLDTTLPPGTDVSCGQVNKRAVATAIELLGKTKAGRVTLARYKARGRRICLETDSETFQNIGPLFVKGSISVKDNSTCIVVKSLALGPVKLDGLIFPGTQYCKFLSPGRVIGFMMIDALKTKTSCLNKK